jgi:hypothetical protein
VGDVILNVGAANVVTSTLEIIEVTHFETVLS